MLDDRRHMDASPAVAMDKMPGADEWPAERFTVTEVTELLATSSECSNLSLCTFTASAYLFMHHF